MTPNTHVEEERVYDDLRCLIDNIIGSKPPGTNKRNAFRVFRFLSVHLFGFTGR